jgi:hypothetical protein
MPTPSWQDYLEQYGPLLGEVLGSATSKGGLAKTIPKRDYGGSPAPTSGAGIDTAALSSGQDPYATSDFSSVNNPAAYGAGGNQMMSTAPKQAEHTQGSTLTSGGSGMSAGDWGNIGQAALQLYGIAKSGSPNEMRNDIARSYGKQTSELPDAPFTGRRTSRAAHAAGTAALNFIPAAGPFLSAGLGLAGDEKIGSDMSKWYHQLMLADPEIQKNPKLETPDVQESGRQKVRRYGRAAGTAAASYFGGPIIGALAGGVKQVADKKVAERRAKKAKAIAKRNQKVSLETSKETRRKNLVNEAVGQSLNDQGKRVPPELQALMELMGGQA